MANSKIINAYLGEEPLGLGGGLKSLLQSEYNKLVEENKVDPNTIYLVFSDFKVVV